MKPVSITVAPNGARRTKSDHPALPVTADEVARAVAACREKGAAMAHVHVRGRNGEHILDVEAYRDVTSAIRREAGPDIVIQITTEAVGRYGPAQQAELIRSLKPQAASIALREIAPGPSEEDSFAELLSWMNTERVSPQIILYDRQDAARLEALETAGKIPFDEIPVLYVLGRYTAGQVSRPIDLLAFLEAGRARRSRWSVCAFGMNEAACVTTGALLGGHIRVGFENNLWLPDGSIAGDNAALVSTVAEGLSRLNIHVMDGPTLWEELCKAFC